MTIRVVQQLRHDRYEVILDGFFREFIDVPRSPSRRPRLDRDLGSPDSAEVRLEVAQNQARS